MGENIVLDTEMVRVLDILEQVKKLNKMISLHKKGGDTTMIEQYQDLKQRFLKELKEVLLEFQIEVKVIDHAA